MTATPALLYSTPEAQGIPTAAISAFVDAAERELDALHSFILLRHGHRVAAGWWEPYRPEDPHMLFSLSKSVTSTAIGLLVGEGRLLVDDPVLDFFPDEAPPAPSPNLRAMQVRHLLSMTTGHAVDTTEPMVMQTQRSWVANFLAQPVDFEPGTHFVYNSGATYLLSAIVQKLAGERMSAYLGPRLFAPLGMVKPRWQTSPQGIDTGGWGLRLTTAEVAAFGQLYLQQGRWQGDRILSQAWVDAATSRQAENGSAPDSDWEQGYGYQFWRCRHDAYRADGAFGQYCLVLPAQDAVLAITSGLADMQPPLNLVWEHLLPAMGAGTLPEDRVAQAALAAKLAGLQLPPPAGAPRTPAAAWFSERPFRIAANPAGITTIRFDFGPEETGIRIRDAAGEERIVCGQARWVRNASGIRPLEGAIRSSLLRDPAHLAVGARGAWTAPTTYTAKLWWYETPFAVTLTCAFTGPHLTLTAQPHIGFGPLDPVRLEGRSGG